MGLQNVQGRIHAIVSMIGLSALHHGFWEEELNQVDCNVHYLGHLQLCLM